MTKKNISKTKLKNKSKVQKYHHSRLSNKQKYIKKRKTSKSRNSIIKFIGGGEVLNPESFLKNLNQKYQSEILSNINLSDMSLEDIKNKYRGLQKYHLYDFIFDLSQNNPPKLIKVWDHNTNDPESITAGLPGIHIYTIIDNDIDNKFKIIGKFTRK